ncbi:MAG: DUF4440 domain-containing protein [Lewinellaceae bacterium]|nr:DUF4440 domain-containing protein [Lewinellaceae bacterium]
MNNTAITLFCMLLSIACLQAQVAQTDPLFISLKQQDSIFFERGFNQCDLEYLEQAVHPDLVFFHDQGGFQNRTVFFENVRQNLCADPNQKPIRKLEEGSLEVYPLYNNGQLYGAIQNGVHKFFIREPGKADVPTSTAKFTHLYLLEDDKWMLREVLSFDHKNIEPAPAKGPIDDILWTAAWGPDGRFIATGGNHNVLRIFSGTTFEPAENYPVKGTITNLKWHLTCPCSPSRRGFADQSSAHLETASGPCGTVQPCTACAPSAECRRRAAVGDNEGQLHLFSKDGTLLRTIDVQQKSITGLDWHPTQNIVATVGHHIALYDTDQEKLTAITPRPEDVLMLCVAWHPTGAFFATGDYGDYEKNYPPLLQFWSSDGRKINDIAGSQAEYRALRWSPDGNRWQPPATPCASGRSTANRWAKALPMPCSGGWIGAPTGAKLLARMNTETSWFGIPGRWFKSGCDKARRYRPDNTTGKNPNKTEHP